jgi:hypothetical protein
MKGDVTALGSDFGSNEAGVRTLGIEARVDRDVAFVNCGFRLVHDDTGRVNRGGSWYYTAGLARAADRDWYNPGVRRDILGLRLVRDMEGTWPTK